MKKEWNVFNEACNNNLNEDLDISELAINLSFLTTNLDSTNLNNSQKNYTFEIKDDIASSDNINFFKFNNFQEPAKVSCISNESDEFPNSSLTNSESQFKKQKNLKKINLNHLNKCKSLPGGYYMALFNMVQGNIINFVTQFTTSKQIQKALPSWNEDILISIFYEIYAHIPRLIVDPYANYFCQKLYQHLSKNERIHFILTIQPCLFDIACNNYGNYTLQFMIENFKSDEEIKLFLIPFINPLFLQATINNTIGLNVIEKLIRSLNELYINFIYEYVIRDFKALSSKKTTINLIKKTIMSAGSFQTKLKIVNVILSNFNYLIYDSIANNSIQCVLEVNNKLIFFYNILELG
jgi:pumilio RNA-binding family